MNLVTTTQSIEIDLAGAVAATEMQFTADWVDHTTTTDTPGHTDGVSTGTTAATMVAAPAGSTYRIVKHLSVYNKDTANATVTVQFNNNSTLRELIVAHLVPGNSIEWTSENGWALTQVNAATDATAGVIRMASYVEHGIGTAVAAAVNPAYLFFHPATAKCWVKAAGAGTSINASYNVSSISDINTGRLGVNMARGLITFNYSIIVSIIRGVTTYAVADVEDCNVRFSETSPGHFVIESNDHTATTMVADDPASYFGVVHGAAI